MNKECKTHELATVPENFSAIESKGRKFTIRRFADYEVGDKLVLKEYYRGKYTGRELIRFITEIYYGDGTYGLSNDFCILSMAETQM